MHRYVDYLKSLKIDFNREMLILSKIFKEIKSNGNNEDLNRFDPIGGLCSISSSKEKQTIIVKE